MYNVSIIKRISNKTSLLQTDITVFSLWIHQCDFKYICYRCKYLHDIFVGEKKYKKKLGSFSRWRKHDETEKLKFGKCLQSPPSNPSSISPSPSPSLSNSSSVSVTPSSHMASHNFTLSDWSIYDKERKKNKRVWTTK